MSPLHTYHELVVALRKKPLFFWPPSKQGQWIASGRHATERLEKTLEAKGLSDTVAYRHVMALAGVFAATQFDELAFLQSLASLLDVYRHAPLAKEMAEFIQALEKDVVEAKKKIAEHVALLERIAQEGKKLSVEDKQKRDLDTMQKRGIFYVLEYTLQVLYEFTRRSPSDQIKLLDSGLAVDAGNLPAYRPLEDSFRVELCYRIFDLDLRQQLLASFYSFEEVLFGDDILLIKKALQQFNISLLRAFDTKGLHTFDAAVYAPFGNHVPTVQVIASIEKLF